MNRSRETMQFIQALSAPTRASFSLYLEYKELLAFIPVIPTASVHRLPTGLFPPPSPSNRRVCVYQPDTTIEIRNVSIFFLLFLWTSSPLFFSNAARRSFSSATNHPLWKSIDRGCPTKSRSIEGFFKDGPRRYLSYEIFMNGR